MCTTKRKEKGFPKIFNVFLNKVDFFFDSPGQLNFFLC